MEQPIMKANLKKEKNEKKMEKVKKVKKVKPRLEDYEDDVEELLPIQTGDKEPLPLPLPIPNGDISGVANANDQYEGSLIKKWIKLIPLDKTISLEEYNRKEHFIPIADIILDTETGKDSDTKKRNTLIQFVRKISKEEFEKKTEWLYLLVINGRIVKIGGTRTGIKGRVGSYLCGHHVEERGKSGDCSKTNGFIYNTFEFYLSLGCKIEMYGYELPKTEIIIEIFGKQTTIVAQTFHAYESTFLEDYKKNYNEYPILSDNCDPGYKE